ncbi:MAG: long-chain fatty acid--CoA ligase [Bacteroidales bacterium]|nr:long-chain fatty acid--CoA ligase [Bacteroidales bacterium]
MEIKRVFDLLDHYVEKYPNQKEALSGKKNGRWVHYSIQDYIEHANILSYALIELGIEKGDKVAMILANRPEWNMLDMAIGQVGGITVPVYPTISEEDYRYILADCDAKMVIIDGLSVMHKVTSILPDAPNVKLVYTMVDREKYPYFDQLLQLGREHPHVEELAARKAAVDEMECATIIYTSGTTGTPKGVMLSHHNLMNQFPNFHYTISDYSNKAFSFLPVCHAYERALNYCYQYRGMSIYYAENLGTIASDMRDIHPTMMCAVPRVLERFYDAICQSGKKQKGIAKSIFFWALHLGERYKIEAENRNWFYNLKLGIADKLVYSKIRANIGAENFDIIVSGAAAISQKIAGFFSAIKMPVFEGYGLTETSPVITVSNRNPHGREVGYVGQPLPGTEVKIADNGEILCRGHNVMMGYYKQPELTKEVIDEDGWFHTGDMGELNQFNQLRITGRIKSLFKTSGGKYINPDMIEAKFSSSKLIEQILVVGENQKFAGALIIPSFTDLKAWCAEKNIPYTTNEEMIRNPEVLKRYVAEINELNKSLGETEKVKKHVLLADEWSIANGLLTPTLKVKRKIITAKYKDVIEKMFA